MFAPRLRAATAWLLILGSAASLFLAWVSPAAAQTFSINQKRMRIEELVKRVAEANQRTVLVPDDVRGTVSVVAKRPVTPEEAWAILDSCLSVLGFSLLPSTVDNWKIAKVANAVGESPFKREAGGDSDAYITTLIPLENARLTDVLAVLQPLSGSRAILVPFDETNSLIVSGGERAVARLTRIADELDIVEESELRLRILRYRDVGEVEGFVETFLEAQSGRSSDAQVWSDARTNAIVVRGGPVAVARILDLIDRLDRPIVGGGQVQILRVLHRDAEEIAELIRSMGESGGGGGEGGAPEASRTALDGADYSIAVDSGSRSLVVRANTETHAAIRDLLEILDAPSELIAVDITVSEIRTPENFGLSMGFVLPFAAGNDTSDLFGFVNSSPSLDGVQVSPTLQGRVQRDTGVTFTTPGPDGALVTVPILQSGSFAAADFEGRTEVLIQPSLIVTAGEQHEIFVGSNVPVPVTESGFGDTSTAAAAAATGGVSSAISALTQTTRIDRRDVGTQLTVEASAGKEGKITLNLEVEISAISGLTSALGADATSQLGAIFTEKKLSATARLTDGETAILAVDQRQNTTHLNSGVPFLRDLPVFGALFRTKGQVVEDIRLVIAARARRVSSPAELVADTIRRRLIFERQRARENTLPEIEGPPFGVRVTTRRLEEDATAIAESLTYAGHQTTTHGWTIGDETYHDVYVIGLASMVDAAQVAQALGEEGWEADLVILSKRF